MNLHAIAVWVLVASSVGGSAVAPKPVPKPAPAAAARAKGRAALEAALARGELTLLSEKAEHFLAGPSYAPSKAPEAWFVDVALWEYGRRPPPEWDGDVGHLPLAPIQREGDRLGLPRWEGDTLVFTLDGAACVEDRLGPGELRIRPVSDGRFDVTITPCSRKPIPMRLGEGPGARFARWSRETADRLLVRAARTIPGLERRGERWQLGSSSFAACSVCAVSCEGSRLGVVCEGDSPDGDPVERVGPVHRLRGRSRLPEAVYFVPVGDHLEVLRGPGPTYGRCDLAWGTMTGCYLPVPGAPEGR